MQSAGSAYQLTGARLKQEFVRHGHMLGALLRYTQSLITQMAQTAVCNRQGVTEAAGKLQQQGVIRYSRGKITVLDRLRLEALSCECYAVVKTETYRLLAPQVGKRAPSR